MRQKQLRVKPEYIEIDPLSYYMHDLFALLRYSIIECRILENSIEVNEDIDAIRSFHQSVGLSLNSIVGRYSEYEVLLATAYSHILMAKSMTTDNADQIYIKDLLEDFDHITGKIQTLNRHMNLAHIAVQTHLELVIELLGPQEELPWLRVGRLYKIRDDYFEEPDSNYLRKYLAEANSFFGNWPKDYWANCSTPLQLNHEKILTREVELETFLLLTTLA